MSFLHVCSRGVEVVLSTAIIIGILLCGANELCSCHHVSFCSALGGIFIALYLVNSDKDRERKEGAFLLLLLLLLPCSFFLIVNVVEQQ